MIYYDNNLLFMTVLLWKCSHFQVLVIEWVTDLSCAHTHLWAIFIVQVQKWTSPSESWACSESCQHKCWKPARDALLCPSRTQGSGALPLPHACTVTQQLECWYACWCKPVVQAPCEEFGWLFCKAFDNRLWFYTSPATVSCICCCCKFGPSDCELYWFTRNNGLDLSFCPQPVQKSSAVPLVIVFPLGL